MAAAASDPGGALYMGRCRAAQIQAGENFSDADIRFRAGAGTGRKPRTGQRKPPGRIRDAGRGGWFTGRAPAVGRRFCRACGRGCFRRWRGIRCRERGDGRREPWRAGSRRGRSRRGWNQPFICRRYLSVGSCAERLWSGGRHCGRSGRRAQGWDSRRGSVYRESGISVQRPRRAGGG